jgi:hypothetical protein
MKIIHKVIKEQKDLDKPLKLMIKDIHKRSADLKPVFSTIIKKSQKNRIDYLTLPGHYIHMMLNRFFYEQARLHELIIYEFLRRYYASEIARSKKNGIPANKL